MKYEGGGTKYDTSSSTSRSGVFPIVIMIDNPSPNFE